jgi:hypothetical protein
LPDGSTTDRFIEQDRWTDTQTLLTIPMIGWASKRRTNDHPFDCGFKVSLYGAQQETDSAWDPDCGNGIKTDGTSTITGNNPLDTSTIITPTFVQSWMSHLAGRYGTAANGGMRFYNLDNEPMLWNSTHRDVHPNATSYDELYTHTIQYASAIKANDPDAKILGPVLWGWTAYFYSALDITAGGDAWWDTRPDYPQAEGIFSDSPGDASVQALRLRSTRSLWDPTYADESWIAQTEGGPAVRLIPRMQDWVNANYSDTKLGISGYGWGAICHMNGALAQADVLGIFSRERLDLATLWGPPSADQPGAFAFRIYRNYDGQGYTFGETGVRAASGDQSQLAIYSSQRTNDNALTVLVINKIADTLASTMTVSRLSPKGDAQVYQYSDQGVSSMHRLPNQSLIHSSLNTALPGSSITLFIFPSTDNLLPSIFLPLIRR